MIYIKGSFTSNDKRNKLSKDVVGKSKGKFKKYSCESRILDIFLREILDLLFLRQ